ncbi:MAG: hypothetical protein KBA71_14670 [Opitutaceae bacterium]|nr:hypothetical protein [Opitutaceae bacterium]
MTTLLILGLSTAGVVVLLGAPVWFAFRNAAVGYQDAEGFHLGVEPAPAEAPLLELPVQTKAAEAGAKKSPSMASDRNSLVVAGDI